MPLNDLNVRRKRRLQKLVTEFRDVSVEDILPEILAAECISQRAEEEIRCALERKGKAAGADKLRSEIISRNKWFETLLQALQNAGYGNLSKKLSTDDQGSLLSYDPSTCPRNKAPSTETQLSHHGPDSPSQYQDSGRLDQNSLKEEEKVQSGKGCGYEKNQTRDSVSPSGTHLRKDERVKVQSARKIQEYNDSTFNSDDKKIEKNVVKNQLKYEQNNLDYTDTAGFDTVLGAVGGQETHHKSTDKGHSSNSIMKDSNVTKPQVGMPKHNVKAGSEVIHDSLETRFCIRKDKCQGMTNAAGIGLNPQKNVKCDGNCDHAKMLKNDSLSLGIELELSSDFKLSNEE